MGGGDGVVVLCVCVCVCFEGRGQRELVGVKTGYDIVYCYMKEEVDGSRWM